MTSTKSSPRSALAERALRRTSPQPAVTDPLDTEPLDTEPLDTEPLDTEPFDTEPFDTEPFDTEPFDTEPLDTEPLDTEPFDTEPLDTKPLDSAASFLPAHGAPPRLGSMSKSISRRVFLARGVAFGAAAGAVLTVGCGGGEEALTCTDVSGLSPAEQAARSGLGYVDASPHGAQKNCANCNFYQAGAANACGSCTLVKGPIHPSGYCNSWAAKA